VLTGARDGKARLWETPWLSEDISPGRLMQLSELVTIKKISRDGEVIAVPPAEWEAVQRALKR
jgi:hypothetical protein